jgi:hypothetical protein
VAVEPPVGVGGAVAPAAAGAVVVSAAVADGAVEGEDVVVAVVDAAGVLPAVGADGAGA